MKLVDGANEAWKWFSMQSMGLVIILLGAWGAMPDDLKDAIPHWVVAAIAIIVLLLGVAGRLLQQGKPNG